VDLDNDGVGDLLCGSWPGQLYLFRGLGGGKFAAGQQLQDHKAATIKLDYASAPHTTDWDADGDLDLLVGSSTGHVHLLLNVGTQAEHAFGKAAKLTAGGEPIQVPGGFSSPAVADFDGDGKRDLLVGADDGSVLWYRNLGTTKRPELAAGRTIVPAPRQEDQRGSSAKICLTDFNQDGVLDLLIGDRGEAFERELSEEETQWREEALRQQAKLLRTWAGVFTQYRQLLQEPQPDQRQAQLQSLRDELQRLKDLRNKFHHEERALQPGKQYHGRVWLFLGRKP